MFPPASQGEPWVRLGGDRLANDLRLLALRARWPQPTATSRAEALAAWQVAAGQAVASDPEAVVATRGRDLSLWRHAAEVAGQAQRDLADTTDPGAWAAAAGDTAAALAPLATRLEKSGHGPLSHAADELARSAQQPRQPDRRHDRPAALRGLRVVRVAATAALASRGGPVGAVTLGLTLGKLIRTIELARTQPAS